MPDRFVESHIRQLPLFARLPPDQFRWAMEAIRVMRYEVGENIFDQGQPTQGMYMFVSGRAVLVQTDAYGRQQQLGVIGPNQYLNEAALYQQGVETAALQVIETATVLFISRQRLTRIISYHPEMKAYIPVAAQNIQRIEKVFRGQRDSETVLINTRRHWWAFVRKAWIPGILFGIILIIAGLLPSPGLTLALIGFGLVLAALIMLYIFLEWRNDHIIVTDQRLIHIEQVITTFKTRISEIPLSSIQQINADIITTDPFSRLFDYGTVNIRTAGDAGNMIFRVIPHPEAMQDMLFDARRQSIKERDAEQRSTIRAEIDRLLGHQDEGEAASTAGASTASSSTSNGLAAPWRTHFVNAKGESVYRKHSTFWFRAVFMPSLLIMAAFILIIISIFANLGLIGLPAGSLLFIIGAIWFYWADWDWRNDLYIIGTYRVTMIHRRPLWLQNEDDQFLLESVDNVVSERSGLLRSLFDYGDVKISLLGGDQGDQKVFRAVPTPQRVQAEVTRRQARLRNLDQLEEEKRRRAEIAEYLSVYHETINANTPPGSLDPGISGLVPPASSQNVQPQPPTSQNPLPQPPRPQQSPNPPSPTRSPNVNPQSAGMRPPNIPRSRRK